MNKLFYPAVFHNAEEGGFWVTFPDIPECMTEGDSLDEAYQMSSEALGLCLTDMEKEHIPFPAATDPTSYQVEPNSFLVLIEFDMEAYRKKHNARAVKKTLSIPEWLNEEATSAGVNFSQVLQEALMQKLAK